MIVIFKKTNETTTPIKTACQDLVCYSTKITEKMEKLWPKAIEHFSIGINGYPNI